MSEQIDNAIRWATDLIQDCSESARLDAELLLAHCLDKPRSYLYTWPQENLSASCWHDYRVIVQKRLEPTPVAYLLGSREFYSMQYATNIDALIPRPETELLVELALATIKPNSKSRVIDLGTGTGIIAITLKSLRPDIEMLATDIDAACLDLAKKNAVQHKTEIEFIQSDWYQNLPPEQFDTIVSNPPYIAGNHPFLEQGDLPAEPRLALTPGQTGLESLQQIIAQAPRYLNNAGNLILEHGYDQQTAVADLLVSNGFGEIQCHFDFNDLPRVTTAKLIEKPNLWA
jgi:release factor glutamine methyltransferase